jgi:hypothetical protein
MASNITRNHVHAYKSCSSWPQQNVWRACRTSPPLAYSKHKLYMHDSSFFLSLFLSVSLPPIVSKFLCKYTCRNSWVRKYTCSDLRVSLPFGVIDTYTHIQKYIPLHSPWATQVICSAQPTQAPPSWPHIQGCWRQRTPSPPAHIHPLRKHYTTSFVATFQPWKKCCRPIYEGITTKHPSLYHNCSRQTSKPVPGWDRSVIVRAEWSIYLCSIKLSMLPFCFLATCIKAYVFMNIACLYAHMRRQNLNHAKRLHLRPQALEKTTKTNCLCVCPHANVDIQILYIIYRSWCLAHACLSVC